MALTSPVSRSLVVVLALATAAADADAKCARVLLAPQVLTVARDPIAAGGGVLVGWTETTDDAAERFRGHDPAVNADWGFLVRKRKVRPVIEPLAPGLAVYRAGAARGSVVLRDGDGARLGTFTVGASKAPWAVAAPAVASVTTTTAMKHRGRTTMQVLETSVAFDGAIPADAAAVIVYLVDGATRTPITWARVNGASGAVRVYRTPGRCGDEPDGLRAPAVGQQVELAWVDRGGRLSPRSPTLGVE